MNREELSATLRSEGINPDAYALYGGHPSERLVLDSWPAGWAVYYSERGLESGRREFVTEDEACRHMLAMLRADPTTHFHLVVGPLPASEADAEFAAWLEARELNGIDPADWKADNPTLTSGVVRRYWVRGTVLRR